MYCYLFVFCIGVGTGLLANLLTISAWLLCKVKIGWSMLYWTSRALRAQSETCFSLDSIVLKYTNQSLPAKMLRTGRWRTRFKILQFLKVIFGLSRHFEFVAQCESNPPVIFWQFFPNGWEFLVQILHAYSIIRSYLYAGLQIFIKLPATVTKLCHISWKWHPVCLFTSSGARDMIFLVFDDGWQPPSWI